LDVKKRCDRLRRVELLALLVDEVAFILAAGAAERDVEHFQEAGTVLSRDVLQSPVSCSAGHPGPGLVADQVELVVGTVLRRCRRGV
jgi:hypothetical protein